MHLFCFSNADYEIKTLKNESRVIEFVILGFPGSPTIQYFFFLLLFIIYLVTILSNFAIIAIIWVEKILHTPMYFYLRNLSLLEVCYVTVTVPKVLATITQHGRSILFSSCIMQLFFFFLFGSIECILLGIMAFDRYLAICYPLRYSLLMSSYVCRNLSICSCFFGFVMTFPPAMSISQLSFCESNIINHFFCDAPPLLKLTCGNTISSDLLGFICSSITILTSCFFILMSYFYIIKTVLKIPTARGRKKVFSTSSSHLIVIAVYYSSVMFMYVRPKLNYTVALNRVVAVFYTMITPILNPMVYCLRNKVVQEAFLKQLSLLIN
ncbi:olfactory receptor 6F1-like [Pelobates fuscus]|uniref:olfactory receptor 6F1-like n=1 Tax=Pelobates fuscus TaxID=191477 RepID=UPI002FE4BFB1